MKPNKKLLCTVLALSLCSVAIPTTYATTTNVATITKETKVLTSSEKKVLNCINERRNMVTVDSKPNIDKVIELATNKYVNNYRIRKNGNGQYTIFFNYFSVSNVETKVKEISKHTEAKWGVKLKDTKFKELAIAQYLIDNGVEYNTVNYNPDKLLTDGGSCQAISLFTSAVLDYLNVPHSVVTGKYDGIKHMWIYSGGSMHDLSFAVETKDVQYALQSDPTVYKYDSDFKLDQNNTYTPIDGTKILSTGTETYALREDGKVMCLKNGRQVLVDIGAKDIVLSGGKLVVDKTSTEKNNI